MRLRGELHRLLAVNPNHFGNLKDSTFTAQLTLDQDTTYEQLTCVGFSPEADILEATVQIKRASGYNGNLCSPGSTEWVRFYISYDEGTSWQDVGMGSFDAHDLPDSVDCARAKTKPLVYTVAYPLADPKRGRCARPVLPMVRAILSWQVQPPAGQPDWRPIWGNRLDRHVQIRPRRSIVRDVLADLELDLKKIPDFYAQILPLPVPEPDPAPFALAKAFTSARAGKVPPHRFAAPALAALQEAGAHDQTHLLAASAEFAALDLDLVGVLKDFTKDAGDTTYEQISCVGLDYHRDLLVSTVQVKLPSGFSGPPCSAGSVEYVAFWVDYDNTCKWTYLDTAKFVVHDFDPLPKDGLNYWVGVPARTAGKSGSCAEPKVGRVRAVLSWNTPPSTTDPHAVPRWGNAVETHIEIPPRRVPPVGGIEVWALGRIPVGKIDATGLTATDAKFIEYGTDADSLHRPCPFGGTLVVHGATNDASAAAGHLYRAVWRPSGSSGAGQPVTDPFVTGHVPVTTRTPDPLTGYTPCLTGTANPFHQLAAWRTGGLDGGFEIRLELVDAAYHPIGVTPWYAVLLDNTGPAADITFTSGTTCNKAAPGDSVSGTFSATDDYFGAYSMRTLPASLGLPGPASAPPSGATGVASGTWHLDTADTWPHCGYVIELSVRDRAIVNSTPGSYHWDSDDVGFCLGM